MTEAVISNLPLLPIWNKATSLELYPQYYGLNTWFETRFNFYIWVGNVFFIPYVFTYEILLKDYAFLFSIFSYNLNYILNNLTGYNFFARWLSYTATSFALFFRFIVNTSGYYLFSTFLSALHAISFPYIAWKMLMDLDSVADYVQVYPTDNELSYYEGSQFHYFYGLPKKLMTRWISALSWIVGVDINDTVLALSGLLFDVFVYPIFIGSYILMALCINYDKESWNARYQEF